MTVVEASGHVPKAVLGWNETPSNLYSTMRILLVDDDGSHSLLPVRIEFRRDGNRSGPSNQQQHLQQ
jgi:hypothetical protein